MSNPRLLSSDERLNIRTIEGLKTVGDYELAFCLAQDAKTLKVVVNQMEQPCPHGTLAADTSKAARYECALCWQELVKITEKEKP